MLRDPSSVHRLSWAEGEPGAAAAAAHVGGLGALLERLEADVRACVAADGVYSPLCDLRRRTAGVLRRFLREGQGFASRVLQRRVHARFWNHLLFATS